MSETAVNTAVSIEIDEEVTLFTPYAISKVLNAALIANGSSKQTPPQMMYNYARNGLIVKGEKGRKSYTRDEVLAFVSKYVSKNK